MQLVMDSLTIEIKIQKKMDKNFGSGNKIVETLIFRNAHSQTGVHGVNAVGSVVLTEQKKELVRFDSHVTRSVPRMAKNQF